MKLTILGSGSAYGSPYAGNFFGDVDRYNIKNIRLRPSAYLTDNNDALLIECGPDFRQQMCIHNIKRVDNIFVSHGHADHIMGVWELTRFSKMMEAEINIFGNKDTIDEIHNRFSFMFKEGFKEIGAGAVKLNVIEPLKPFILPKTNMEILPLEFVHKGENILGFKYKNMVYTPDVFSIPEESEPYIKDLDLWVFECDAFHDMKKGHNYLDQALEWIKKYAPKKCVLNHLSVSMDYAKVTKFLPENTALAFDGMEIEL